MDIKNISTDLIFKLEIEENKNKKLKSKDRMMSTAKEMMRKITLEKLEGKAGEC